MNLKSLILSILVVIAFCNSGCKKSGSDKNDEDEIEDDIPCRLLNQSGRNDVGLGFPRDVNRQNTKGTVRVAVIFVDFADAAATRTPQSAFGLMSSVSEDFISEASYGNLTIEFMPHFKWYRMSKKSSDYGWDHLTFNLHKVYIQEAVNLADPDYDFTGIDEIVIISNPDGGDITNGPTFMGVPTNGIHADGRVIGNAITSGRDLLYFRGLWFPHEFGHSMGLPDLYSFTDPLHGYVGNFSLMGNISGTAPDYSAWEKWLLGWIGNSQVKCANTKGTGSLQLTPVEQEEGMKLLILPISTSAAVIVEDRRKTGVDIGLVKEGPVVYLIDTKNQTGAGVLKTLPVNYNDWEKNEAPLSVGQSLTYGGVTIKCTASNADGSTVEYERR